MKKGLLLLALCCGCGSDDAVTDPADNQQPVEEHDPIVDEILESGRWPELDLARLLGRPDAGTDLDRDAAP